MYRECVCSRYHKLAAAVAAAVAPFASPAIAQQQALEEVVVTGSFLTRPEDRPQPITVIDTDEITFQSRGSIGEIIRDLPQVTNTNWTGNFLNPSNDINLRGLGSRATLVLMNGKRQTIDGNGFGTVDINNLAPAIMIQRIEILTDGASALYGSDAVAGVANFITRNEFEGIEVKANTQVHEAETTPEYNVGALFGAQSDEISVVAGLEYTRRGESMQSQDRFDRERLQYGLPSSFGNPGSFARAASPPGALSTVADPLCGNPSIGGEQGNEFGDPAGQVTNNGGTCTLLLSLGRTFVPKSDRMNGLAVATFDLDDTTSLQVESGFARTRYSTNYGFGVPILFPLPPVPGHNPGVIEAAAQDPGWCGALADPVNGCVQDYWIWSRVASPLETPIPQLSEQDTVRFAATLDGMFGTGTWGWSVTGAVSRNDIRTEDSDTIRERYELATSGYGGPACAFTPATDPLLENAGVGDCLYWNPFANRLLAEPGNAHYNDPIVRDWFAAGRITDGFAQLFTLEGLVTGELWEMSGGTTGLALGIQTRSQDYEQKFDDISNDGGFAFNTQVLTDFEGTRDVDALFGELVMYPTDTLEIQLAARYEDYGQFDSTDPKVGFLWTPTDSLFVRATAGTSFRQPGENQSFGISGGAPSRVLVGGEIPQANAIEIGDPMLEPETSDNWTIGLTWDATDNFTMDFTYWSVEFNDLIVSEDADVILQNDIADGFITDPRLPLFAGSPNEVCEVTGRWDGVDTATRPADCVTGFDIELFITSFINQDFQTTSGLDFTFDWEWDLAGGSRLGLMLTGTYTDKYELTTEGATIDGVGNRNATNFGSPNAEWRSNVALDWTNDRHYARATVRYLSALENDDVGTSPLTEEKAFTTLDLLYDYTLPNERSSVIVALLNVTDEEGAIIDQSLTTADTELYDERGRSIRVGLTWGF